MMLPYAAGAQLSVPSNTQAVVAVFSANGLFDPDITFTGEQPMGFDQMMLFYEHYTVLSAEITATFRNISVNTSPSCFLAVRGDVTNITDNSVVRETGNTVIAQLDPFGSFGAIRTLRLRVNVRKFLGIDDLLDSSVARGDVAANPLEGLFFHVGGYNADALAATVLNYQVRIEYHAVFSEPRVITPSLTKAVHALLRTNECKRAKG